MKLYRYPIYGAVVTVLAFAIDWRFNVFCTQVGVAGAILFNLIALAYKASHWRGYSPVRYGLVGAILAFLANATPEAKPLEPLGIAVLAVISLWTAWPPKNPGEKPPCCQ